jgi:LysM repeat protein
LRPDIPQKSGTVPSNDDRRPLVDNRPSVTSEVSRPNGNAAAIFGIAIALGTGSLIAPGFSAVAQANEPASTHQVSGQSAVVVQEPLLTSLSQSQVAVVPQIEPQVVERSLTTTVSPVTSTTAVDAPIAAKSVVALNTGHAVKPGETLWQIAQSYQVEVRALANANRLSTVSVLKVGQILQLPGAIGSDPANGTINLQAIAQSIPAVPVLGAVSELEADVQAQSVADQPINQDQFKPSLAALGEASKSASMVFTEGQLDSTAAAAQPTTGSLSVTHLANVPLPSIGGEEPQMIARPTTLATKVDVRVDASVPAVPQPILIQRRCWPRSTIFAIVTANASWWLKRFQLKSRLALRRSSLSPSR